MVFVRRQDSAFQGVGGSSYCRCTFQELAVPAEEAGLDFVERGPKVGQPLAIDEERGRPPGLLDPATIQVGQPVAAAVLERDEYAARTKHGAHPLQPAEVDLG